MRVILFGLLIATTVAPPIAIPGSAVNETPGATRALGSVSRDEGLKAWKRIEAVVTHPRCANCHVGPDNIPMWTIVGENKNRPHGMNISADTSRAGARDLPCGTCHVTSTAPNTNAHAPPHAGIPWQLAPVDFVWYGKTGAEICQQLRDPKRNGGRDAAELVQHLRHDAARHGFIR